MGVEDRLLLGAVEKLEVIEAHVVRTIAQRTTRVMRVLVEDNCKTK